MISCLKYLLGYDATSKMEGMLNDITEAAITHQTKFNEYMSMHPEHSLQIEFNVTVLRTGTWPNYRSSNINLPSEMVSIF